MAYVAVSYSGAEIIFRNKPQLKDNKYLSYSGEAIKLPHGSIKKLIGRELKFGNDPVELSIDEFIEVNSDESTTDKPRS